MDIYVQKAECKTWLTWTCEEHKAVSCIGCISLYGEEIHDYNIEISSKE